MWCQHLQKTQSFGLSAPSSIFQGYLNDSPLGYSFWTLSRHMFSLCLSLLLYFSKCLPGIFLLWVNPPPLNAFVLPFPSAACVPSYPSCVKLLQLQFILNSKWISSCTFFFLTVFFWNKGTNPSSLAVPSRHCFPQPAPPSPSPSHLHIQSHPTPNSHAQLWLIRTTHLSPYLLIRSLPLIAAVKKH